MRQKNRYLYFAGAMLLGTSAWAQTTVPDAQIEANVLKALAGAPQLANENISSNTVYGVVTLTGTVKDEPTRTIAENLTARANGVKKVVDELAVGSGNADATNPQPQTDGAIAPPASQPQHAPDPDVYAAQQGANNASPQGDPNSNDGNYNQPQPGLPPNNGHPTYRQPYNDPYAQPQGGQSYPAPNGQQSPQDVRPPYQPGGAYQRGPQPGPAPYGAQVGGRPITVPPGALLRVRINEGLDSKHTQPGTVFDAVVLNDVVADGAVAIPRGASIQGRVTDARSGGVIKGHGELALQLTQVTLGGRIFPIASDVWQRDSSDKGSQTVGNAVGLGAAGAIIGAIAGGGAGAALGAGLGGAAGVGTSAASGGRQVVIPSEAILTFHTTQPAPLTTLSQAEMDRLSYGVPAGAQQGQQMMRRRYPQPYYGPPGYYPPQPPPAYPQPY